MGDAPPRKRRPPRDRSVRPLWRRVVSVRSLLLAPAVRRATPSRPSARARAAPVCVSARGVRGARPVYMSCDLRGQAVYQEEPVFRTPWGSPYERDKNVSSPSTDPQPRALLRVPDGSYGGPPARRRGRRGRAPRPGVRPGPGEDGGDVPQGSPHHEPLVPLRRPTPLAPGDPAGADADERLPPRPLALGAPHGAMEAPAPVGRPGTPLPPGLALWDDPGENARRWRQPAGVRRDPHVRLSRLHLLLARVGAVRLDLQRGDVALVRLPRGPTQEREARSQSGP